MLMINGLASLLIITSLCVIMVRTAKKAAMFYGLQSLVLVLLFVYLAYEMQATSSICGQSVLLLPKLF